MQGGHDCNLMRKMAPVDTWIVRQKLVQQLRKVTSLPAWARSMLTAACDVLESRRERGLSASESLCHALKCLQVSIDVPNSCKNSLSVAMLHVLKGICACTREHATRLCLPLDACPKCHVPALSSAYEHPRVQSPMHVSRMVSRADRRGRGDGVLLTHVQGRPGQHDDYPTLTCRRNVSYRFLPCASSARCARTHQTCASICGKLGAPTHQLAFAQLDNVSAHVCRQVLLLTC
jgi:hypothetical protein